MQGRSVRMTRDEKFWASSILFLASAGIGFLGTMVLAAPVENGVGGPSRMLSGCPPEFPNCAPPAAWVQRRDSSNAPNAVSSGDDHNAYVPNSAHSGDVHAQREDPNGPTQH
ncbi:hypothetical protein BC940DRAFT_363675 [Gongronella butleri]|nr:hypothetical protein BC940DRAFT_363675 [Gongronella butleri]